MNIQIHHPDPAVTATNGAEVWVQVTADEPLPDWPTIQERMLGFDWPSHELQQYVPGQRGEPGASPLYEDWWILRVLYSRS